MQQEWNSYFHQRLNWAGLDVMIDWLIFVSYRTLVEFHPHIQIWSDYRINISTWNVFLSRGVFVWPSIHPHLHPFLVLIWFIISQLLIHFFPFSLFPFHVRLPSPSSSLRRCCCCCCCCYGVAYHYTLPQARRVTFKAAPGAPPPLPGVHPWWRCHLHCHCARWRGHRKMWVDHS